MKQYDDLINKIKCKKRAVVILTLIAVFVTFVLCLPARIGSFDYKGVSPVVMVLLVLLLFFCEFVACAFILMPLTTSMNVECDPQKHLALNTALGSKKNLTHIYATDFIYIGNFKTALTYANQMIASKNMHYVNVGLFNKARCEFFLDDFESLKLTVKQYEAFMASNKRMNQKAKLVYEEYLKIMHLMVAIADRDKEKITVYCDIRPWNNSKATQGYINYLKGVAAHITDDKKEAMYRFMSVKENCDKTVLSTFVEKYLLE